MDTPRTFVVLDFVCLCLASLPFALLNLGNSPYERGFYCSDDSIRYPYLPDTIPFAVLTVLVGSFSGLVLSSGEAYLVYSGHLHSHSHFNHYVAVLYKALGAYVFGASVSQSLTALAKFTVGGLRPNFLEVCDPDWSRVNCSGYVRPICRGSPANVTKSRLSFYSGHSSFGMYSMAFLALYVQARLHWPWVRLLRPTVQLVLVAFAIYVGYTRVADNQHHWSDVLTGLVQGALVAGFTVLYVSDLFKVQCRQRVPPAAKNSPTKQLPGKTPVVQRSFMYPSVEQPSTVHRSSGYPANNAAPPPPPPCRAAQHTPP